MESLEKKSPEAVIEDVDAFLRGVIEHGRFDLVFTTTLHESELRTEFTGGDVGTLLGRGAELLNALEHLADRIVARQAHGELHIRFDANGYRAGRERELHLMAEAAAAQVRRFQKPFAFGPMTSFERRIIHTALAQDATVRTESVGGGDDRKIVVHPA
jgi:spoIIIJ-associated protein